jgi:hypothetical protein
MGTWHGRSCDMIIIIRFDYDYEHEVNGGQCPRWCPQIISHYFNPTVENGE